MANQGVSPSNTDATNGPITQTREALGIICYWEWPQYIRVSFEVEDHQGYSETRLVGNLFSWRLLATSSTMCWTWSKCITNPKRSASSWTLFKLCFVIHSCSLHEVIHMVLNSHQPNPGWLDALCMRQALTLQLDGKHDKILHSVHLEVWVSQRLQHFLGDLRNSLFQFAKSPNNGVIIQPLQCALSWIETKWSVETGTLHNFQVATEPPTWT